MEAGNWLAALGVGLDKLGVEADFNRLACEVLPNGTVIAQDVRSGSRFVVRPESDEPAATEPTGGTAATGAPNRPAFKEPTSAEEGFATPRLPTPDEQDTVVPAEDAADTYVPEGDDDPDISADEEIPVDEDSSSLIALDEELEPLDPVEPEDAIEMDSESSGSDLSLLPEAALELIEPVDEDDEEQQTLELIDAVKRARSDLIAWQTALDVCMALVASEAGSALQQEADGGVRFVGTRGPGAHWLAGVKLPRGTGIVGFCMDRIASIIVQDPKNDPRFFRDMDEATGFATRAVLCVPVALEGTVYGCLELVNPPEGQAFTRTHIELVEMVAAALADRLVTGRSPL